MLRLKGFAQRYTGQVHFLSVDHIFRQAIPPSIRFPPSTGGTEKKVWFPVNGRNQDTGGRLPRQRGEPKKIEWFPPLAGGTYRRGDDTLAEKYALASETEPILCTLVSPQVGGTYRRGDEILAEK